MGLMAIAYGVSTLGLTSTFGADGRPIMLAPAIFAFGLVAFGFLGMGPVTIAVDSYGPVTDNAQSVYELSTIEQLPGIEQELKRDYGFDVNFTRGEGPARGERRRRQHLQGDGQAGAHRHGRGRRDDDDLLDHHGADAGPDRRGINNLSILHPPFLLGLITGGAMIYWFTGASTQAVTTGAYRAVEFIKRNIRLEDVDQSVGRRQPQGGRHLHPVRAEGDVQHLPRACSSRRWRSRSSSRSSSSAISISIALFGLFQAIFMANAGGAWDNAKKIVETELKMKGTPLHDASIVGDTVGDPFKDTSSVAMNPVIKFTTLFGLLAVELGVFLTGIARARRSARRWRSCSCSSAMIIRAGVRSTRCASTNAPENA